jgi:manganese transport protein
MSKLVEITLAIMAALGGFVDIGELVFTAQSGAAFRYSLLWVLAFATIGIILYAEICGRIAAVAKQAVFTVIKRKMGKRMAFVVWLASTIVNLCTCAAEIGGIALLLKLLTNFGPSWLPLLVAVVLAAAIWVMPFKWIERVFGLAGLAMLIFVVGAFAVGIDWGAAGRGMVPNVPAFESDREMLLFGYFVVGIISSVMMPYEVYFYSSGGIEEGWKKSDVPMNRAISIIGFALGSLVAMAIVVLGAEIFAPQGIVPDTVGSAALLVATPYGKIGVILALIGMITAVAGAAVETALSGAYNFAQYFDKPWGRSRPARDTPAFDAAWVIMLLLGGAIVSAGVDPILIVELSVMLAVVCLPFTYYPVLSAAHNKSLMGKDRTGPFAHGLGWFYFIVVCIAAVAAPVLLVLTGMGTY